ncbi:MAG: SpoIIE family protein phosphatase, partial [Methanosarcinaceae archaeon]|nr:SpoIIE family protein phosphatase [Methanosarcinaceae archaeon]
MSYFLDIADLNLKKYGESLCGDKVKIVSMDDKTVVVLSDGLGSGVKANILATLTTEIIVRMLCADVDMAEVVKTVIDTLPVCQERKIAYSTFIVMVIQHSDYSYKIMNFDSPSAMLFRNGTWLKHENKMASIQNRDISTFTGKLSVGDYVVLLSDGILHAGLGVKMNFGWSRENVADYIVDKIADKQPGAWNIAHQVLMETYSLYGGKCGDDASVVVLNVRPEVRLTVFTGPPLDRSAQPGIVEKFLSTKGRKVVCGGTTANIVADYLGTEVNVDIKTMTDDVPPIGS